MPQHYPFTAVLGCDASDGTALDDLGLALVLTAVSPEIGGVLVIGDEPEAQQVDVSPVAAHDLVEGLPAALHERVHERPVIRPVESKK